MTLLACHRENGESRNNTKNRVDRGLLLISSYVGCEFLTSTFRKLAGAVRQCRIAPLWALLIGSPGAHKALSYGYSDDP